jgi:hypothetical protein
MFNLNFLSKMTKQSFFKRSLKEVAGATCLTGFRSLRNVAMIACLAVTTMMFVGCDPEEPVEPPTPPTPTDAVELTSPITANTTLKDLGLPIDYYFNGGKLEVKNNAILTIEDSVTIQFRNTGGHLYITDGATLKAMGTASKHIQFVGTSTNKGSWRGIEIATITANELNYVEILNAGNEYHSNSAALYLDNGKCAVRNCLINNSKTNGIAMEGRSDNNSYELTTFTGNTIKNCGAAPILTASYCTVYGLRNLSNDNPFADWTGNTNPYIHITSSGYSSMVSNFTIHALGGFPWYFGETFSLDNDVDVTIEAGAVILMGAQRYINIPATSHLIAEGTPSARITIKGKNDVAGYWDGIVVKSKLPGTKFIYCDISGGGGNADRKSNLYTYAEINSQSYVALDNTTFSKSLHYGLKLESYAGGMSYMGHTIIQSSNPASVTFSQCQDGNIWSNCTGPELIYSSVSEHCDVQ